MDVHVPNNTREASPFKYDDGGIKELFFLILSIHRPQMCLGYVPRGLFFFVWGEHDCRYVPKF